VTSHTVYGIVPIDAIGGLLSDSESLITAPPAIGAKMLPRRSSVEHGSSSTDLSKGGRTDRERKFALYCARNLIERFFNKIKQFDGIATWAKLTCRSAAIILLKSGPSEARARLRPLPMAEHCWIWE
jgi:transposase